MGADSRPENNPNASKNLIPKMSAQAQKFKNFEKSSISLGVRSPWQYGLSSFHEMDAKLDDFCPKITILFYIVHPNNIFLISNRHF